MIRPVELHTRRLNLQTTNNIPPRDGDTEFLEIAIRRCIRNAAGQSSPRNQFERYVSGRLKNPPSPDQSQRLTSRVSQLTDELCDRIRERVLRKRHSNHSSGTGSVSAAGTTP